MKFSYSGNKKFCCLCETEVESFLPFKEKMANEYFKIFEVIGSDIHNYFCPKCKSNDRERHLLLYFLELGLFELINKSEVLYIAPDKRLIKKFLGNPDLIIGDTDVARYQKLNFNVVYSDLTNLDFADNYFEVLISNHVLEHIPDYHQALKEINRVLKVEGYAILQTPFSPNIYNNFEDSLINTEELKQKFYGERLHERIFGLRLFDDIKGAGFNLHYIRHDKLLNEYDSKIYGINRSEGLILASKGNESL